MPPFQPCPLQSTVVYMGLFPRDLPERPHASISKMFDAWAPGRSCPRGCSAEVTKEAHIMVGSSPTGLCTVMTCGHRACGYGFATGSLQGGSLNTCRVPGELFLFTVTVRQWGHEISRCHLMAGIRTWPCTQYLGQAIFCGCFCFVWPH